MNFKRYEHIFKVNKVNMSLTVDKHSLNKKFTKVRGFLTFNFS